MSVMLAGIVTEPAHKLAVSILLSWIVINAVTSPFSNHSIVPFVPSYVPVACAFGEIVSKSNVVVKIAVALVNLMAQA